MSVPKDPPKGPLKVRLIIDQAKTWPLKVSKSRKNVVSSILPKNEQDAIILFRDLLTFNVGNVVEWPSFIHSLGISSDEELMLMFADDSLILQMTLKFGAQITLTNE